MIREILKILKLILGVVFIIVGIIILILTFRFYGEIPTYPPDMQWFVNLIHYFMRLLGINGCLCLVMLGLLEFYPDNKVLSTILKVGVIIFKVILVIGTVLTVIIGTSAVIDRRKKDDRPF